MEDEVRRVFDTIPELIWTADLAGHADFVNRRWCEYTGMTVEESGGFGWQTAIQPDDLARLVDYWQPISPAGGPRRREIEARIRRSDGVYRWFLFRCSPLHEGRGEVTRWYVTSADIDDRKRAEDALRASEENFRSIVDGIPGLVFTTTAEGEVEFVNRQLREYFGIPLEEVKAWTTGSVVHPEDLPEVIAKWKQAVDAGQPYVHENRLRRADGTYRWFHARTIPRRDAQGRILRWYALLTDIEDLKAAEEKLRRSEASLLEAQSLAHTGSWSLDSATGLVTSSPEMRRLAAAGPDDDPGKPNFWFDRIHPDDRERVRRTFDDSLGTKSKYETEYRLLLPDGTIRYLRSIGHPVLDKAGELVEFVGTSIDTTEQSLATEEIKRLKDRLHEENVALREQIEREFLFEEIVGSSPALQAVLANIVKVGPTDSTVLILGETGTGKELIARAIHRRSRRASKAFVAVNCAAMPRELIASELFGHEKGAFTGAIQRRIGRFELASGGTLFLDEVGELSLDTQVALLRVLQEREFERVGGRQSIQVDVRVIAATNRDLQAAVDHGAFRQDLFYRLNVFPLEIPPLRERREDIPLLVEYFLDRYARKAGKAIRRVNKRTLDRMQSYPWPGNVRELQNVIERSVIVCDTDEFTVDESWLSRRPLVDSGATLPGQLVAHEKAMIEETLRASGGRVFGPTGAAARLGIPRSTLESKIRALKINKNRFRTRPS
jgi:formate hydrogenlyase transcriptional activator